MKKFLSSLSLVVCMVFILVFQFMPIFAYSASTDSMCGEGTISCFLVKCEAGPQIENSEEHECGFSDVVREIKLLSSTAFKLAVPITVFAIAYAGIKILLAQGNPSKISDARKMLTKIIIGFIFILSAWLIVYTITSFLLDTSVPSFLSK